MVKFVRLAFHERSEVKRLSRTNPALAGWWFRVPDTGKYRVQISDFRFQNWTIFRAAEQGGRGTGDPSTSSGQAPGRGKLKIDN